MIGSFRVVWFGIAVLTVLGSVEGNAQWSPVEGHIMTRWAKDVTPENAHREYPRPQLVRERWRNLNGLWDYAITDSALAAPAEYEGSILVPYPVESSLSGVQKIVGPGKRLWYRRNFENPWQGERVLLHFGAVDWETEVWVNGVKVGEHRGGYDAFSFDITAALKQDGDQEIVVAVWDPSDAGYQPRGKQVVRPRGIYYTPTTGIWQTVWLEPVSGAYINGLKITPDVDGGAVRIVTVADEAENAEAVVVVRRGDTVVARASGTPNEEIRISLDEIELWSPDSPFLYDVTVDLQTGGETIDTVSSYFGMRKIEVAKDEAGVNRFFLNDEVLFHYGPLDQGFWPDGLYTAPTDEALRYDIEITKKLGFNMIRKHVKIEPARWYYWCDRLGVLVWQDMPSGDRYIKPNEEDIVRTAQSERQFRGELRAMVDGLYSHPSIVMWVPFNEGWGQSDTAGIAAWLKEYDPGRLVNSASGWTDRDVGDVRDVHAYPGPTAPRAEENRAAVLGEFGGLGLPLEGHTWRDKQNWGYRSFETRDALFEAYSGLLEKLKPLVEDRLAAAVYTQTTDVEIEVNGLMTYDRAEVKMGIERLAGINAEFLR